MSNPTLTPHSMINGNACFAYFNKIWGIPAELRALRRLQREQRPTSAFVFTSERGAPFSTAGFARMVERAGIEANLGFKAHPHMLRHACA